MVYGVLLLINFAHGDIFMVGAYVGFFIASFLLGRYTDFSPGLPPALLFLITLILTMIITSGVGIAIERVAYRPLRRKGASRLYLVITALMCGLILENGNLAILGASRRSFPQLFSNTAYNVGGVIFTNVKLLVVLTTILVFVLIEAIVRKTRIGMAMRAVSYDRMAVPLMGIPLDTVIVFTFVMGSSMAALAGVLFAMAYPVLDPYMGALVGWKAFIAAVLGGIGEIRGAIAGGFLLGFVEIFVAAFFPSTLRDLIAFSILLAFLSMRPTGIFGVARATKI
jgi:branched-chain amino acid transport system permease protein